MIVQQGFKKPVGLFEYILGLDTMLKKASLDLTFHEKKNCNKKKKIPLLIVIGITGMTVLNYALDS